MRVPLSLEDGKPILTPSNDMLVGGPHSTVTRPGIDLCELIDEELRVNGTTLLILLVRSRLLHLADECNDDDPEKAIAYRQDAGQRYVLPRFAR